ncbi:hypothetical protein M8J77_016207 [Diaphorina citri]|nr:hypothetical protein M8J77_016207 [Diaphorina citri]
MWVNVSRVPIWYLGRPNDNVDQIKSGADKSRTEKSLSSLLTDNDYLFNGDFKLVKNIFSDCLHEDLSLCLKLKAVNVLNRALVKDDIDIIDGVRLKRTVDVNITQFDPTAIQSARNMDASQKESQVDQLIQKQVTTLFSSRSIESEESIPPEEGRGKKKVKKELGQLLATAAVTAGAILGPLFLKSIALIAGKALIISKIAIVIAGTIALKKLLSQPPHHETETVSHHYGRSFDVQPAPAAAQEQAYRGQQPQPFAQSEGQTPSPSSSPPPPNSSPEPSVQTQDGEDFTGRKKYYDYEDSMTPTRIIIENGRRPVTEDDWRPNKKKHSDPDYDDDKYYKYAYKEKHHRKKPAAVVEDYEPMKEASFFSQMEYYEDERPVRKRPGVLDLDDDDDDVPPRRKTAYNKYYEESKKDSKKKQEEDTKNKKKGNEKTTTAAPKKQDKADTKNKILLVTLTNNNKNTNNSKVEERVVVDHKKGNLKEEKIIKHHVPKIPFVHLHKPHHTLDQKEKDVLLKIGKLKIGLFGGTIAMLFITLIDFLLFTMYRSKDKDMQKIIDNLPPQYVSDMKPSQRPSDALVDMSTLPNYPKYPGQMHFNPHDSSLNQIPYAPSGDSHYKNVNNQLNSDMLKYLNNIQAQTGGQFNLSDLRVPDDLSSLDTPGQEDGYNYNQPNLPPTGTAFDDLLSIHGANNLIKDNAGLYTTAQQYSIGTIVNTQPSPTSSSALDSGTLYQLLNTPQKNETNGQKEKYPTNNQPYYQLPLENEVKNQNYQLSTSNEVKTPSYQLPLNNEVKTPSYQLPLNNDVKTANYQISVSNEVKIPGYSQEIDHANKDTWQNVQTEPSLYNTVSYSNANNAEGSLLPQTQGLVNNNVPQYAIGNFNLQNSVGNLNLPNYYVTPSQASPLNYGAVPSTTQSSLYHSNYKVTSLPINPYSNANQVYGGNYVYTQDPYKQISNVLSNQFDHASNHPIVKQFLQNPFYDQQQFYPNPSYDQQIAGSSVNTGDSDFGSSNKYVQITGRPTKLQSKYKRIIKRRKIPTKRTVPRYRIRATTENSVPVSPSGRFKRNADFNTVESFIKIRNTLVQQETPLVLLNANLNNLVDNKDLKKNPNSIPSNVDENESEEVTASSVEELKTTSSDEVKTTSSDEELKTTSSDEAKTTSSEELKTTSSDEELKTTSSDEEVRTTSSEKVKTTSSDEELKTTSSDEELKTTSSEEEVKTTSSDEVKTTSSETDEIPSNQDDENTSSEEVDDSKQTSEVEANSEYDDETSEEVTQKIDASTTIKPIEKNEVQTDLKLSSNNIEKQDLTEANNEEEIVKKNKPSSENHESQGSSVASGEQVATVTEMVAPPVKFTLITHTASPIKKEPVTKQQYQPNVLSTERYYSPIITEKYYLTKISDTYHTPITTEKYYSTLSTEKYYTPISSEKYYATIPTEKYAPLSTTKYQEPNPISTEKYFVPLVSVKYTTETDKKKDKDDENIVTPSGLVSTIKPVEVKRKPIQETPTKVVKRKTTVNKDNEGTKKRQKQSSTKTKKKNKERADTTTKVPKKNKKKTTKKPASKNENQANSTPKTKTTIKEDTDKFKQIQEDGSKVIKIIIEPPAYQVDKKDEDDEYDLYDDDKEPEKPGADDYFSFGIGSPKDAPDEQDKIKEDEEKIEEEGEEEEDEKDSDEEEDEEEEEKDATGSTEDDEEEDEDDDDLGNALSLFYNAVVLDGASVIDTGLLS